MPNTLTYVEPAIPGTIHVELHDYYLDGHRTGWQDALDGNTGHGTEPPADLECDAWYDGWDAGVEAFRGAATR